MDQHREARRKGGAPLLYYLHKGIARRPICGVHGGVGADRCMPAGPTGVLRPSRVGGRFDSTRRVRGDARPRSAKLAGGSTAACERSTPQTSALSTPPPPGVDGRGEADGWPRPRRLRLVEFFHVP